MALVRAAGLLCALACLQMRAHASPEVAVPTTPQSAPPLSPHLPPRPPWWRSDLRLRLAEATDAFRATHTRRRLRSSAEGPEFISPTHEPADHKPRSASFPWALTAQLGVVWLLLSCVSFELLRRYMVPYLLQKQRIRCSRLVLRLSSHSISFALQELSLTAADGGPWIGMINDNALGGYLPCKLERIALKELCITFRVWVLFLRLLEAKPKLLARLGGLLNNRIARLRSAREFEVELQGVELIHTGLGASKWWGGNELYELCIDRKLSSVDEALELIMCHLAYGGQSHLKGDQRTRMKRKLLCSTRVSVGQIRISFADATSRLLLNLDVSGVVCCMGEAKGDRVAELSMVPDAIELEIERFSLGVERLKQRVMQARPTQPPCMVWEGGLRVAVEKQRRPDQIAKKLVNVNCASVSLPLLPTHITLLSELLGLYSSYTGRSYFVQQQVNSGVRKSPSGWSLTTQCDISESLIFDLLSMWSARAEGLHTNNYTSLVASSPLDLLFYSRLLSESVPPLSNRRGKRVAMRLFRQQTQLLSGSSILTMLSPAALARGPWWGQQALARVGEMHRAHRVRRSFSGVIPRRHDTGPASMPEGAAFSAQYFSHISQQTSKLAAVASEAIAKPRKFSLRRAASCLGRWIRSVLLFEDAGEDEVLSKEDVHVGDGPNWLESCIGQGAEAVTLRQYARDLIEFESAFGNDAWSRVRKNVYSKPFDFENRHSARGGLRSVLQDRFGSRTSIEYPTRDRSNGVHMSSEPSEEARFSPQEIPSHVLQQRARQLLNCVEQLMYDPPPKRLAHIGFPADACGMHATIALKKLKLTIADEASDIADFIVSPSLNPHHSKDPHGFVIEYTKTRQLKTMQLSLGVLNIIDQRERMPKRTVASRAIVAPFSPNDLLACDDGGRPSGGIRKMRGTGDESERPWMFELTLTQRVLDPPSSIFLLQPEYFPRWKTSLSVAMYHTAICIMPALADDISAWCSPRQPSDSERSHLAWDKIDLETIKERSIRRELEVEMAPPELRRDDGKPPTMLMMSAAVNPFRVVCCRLEGHEGDMLSGADATESLMLNGSCKEYSIGIGGVCFILPSSTRCGSSTLAFCIALEDGLRLSEQGAHKQGSHTWDVAHVATPRDANLESDDLSPHDGLPNYGEFLHVCSKSDSENVNLNCFLSMRSVLLDTKIVAEGGHRYLLLSPFAHHHVLEPTHVRVEHMAMVSATYRHHVADNLMCSLRDLERSLHINVNTSEDATMLVGDEKRAHTGEEALSKPKIIRLTMRDMAELSKALALLYAGRKHRDEPAHHASTPPKEDQRTRPIGEPSSLDAMFPSVELMHAKVRCTLTLQALGLECHGEVCQSDKPMLRLSLNSLVSELVLDRHSLPMLASAVTPQRSVSNEAMLFTAIVKIEASYLNLNIFELEPFLEPWEVAFYAVNPPDIQIISAKLYSTRLLHLNMTTALHSTLSSLRSALEAERARASIQLADSSLDGSGVRDLASGSLGCCLRGANDPCQFRLVKKSSVRELRWSPPLLIPTSEMRTRAHRVWPVGSPLCPHAVVVSSVGVAHSGSTDAGGKVELRSNLTIRNTLRVKAHLLFERLHTAGEEGRHEYKELCAGGTFHVPLHLTSNTRLAVRPFAPGDEQRVWTQLLPSFPGRHDAQLDNLSDAQQPVMPCLEHARRRALVFIRRHVVFIQNPTWGPVPDVLLALVPKFTIENRLPIGIQFRLSATRSRERSYTANPPLTAHPLPTIVPVSSDLEQTSDVPPSRVTVLSRSVSPPLQTTSEVATTMLPALTREASAPLGQTEPTSRPTELCTRMRDTLREVIDASPCAEALASSPCGAMHLGESQPLTQEMCEESLQREGSFYRTSEGEQRPQVVRTRREAAFNLGSDGDPVREEELIDGLPVGEHCEVLSDFMLQESNELYLQLRYSEDSLESGSEYACSSGIEQLMSVPALHASHERDEHEETQRLALRLAARELAAKTAGTWVEERKLLPVSAFERSQMPQTRAQQVAAVGFHRSKASTVRFDLNEQMQVWAELTGGGCSQPVRIILYSDVCLINQTTLQLAPLDEDKRPVLNRNGGGGGVGWRLKPEALTLLCYRAKSHRPLDKLRLRVSGVSWTTTRNQKLEAPRVDGEWSGRMDEEAYSPTVGLANLSVCEPNERLLLNELCGASSSPIITTMSYYGEVWLDGTDGLLGINTRLQPQELVPPTTIISVKPRFALANRLRDPLQYFPASAGLWSEGEALHRMSGSPSELRDLVRPYWLFAKGSLPAKHHSLYQTSEDTADPPEELLKLSDMPAAPPATVTPIYSFSHSHNDLSALRIFLRVATQYGAWSMAIPVNQPGTFYFFADTWQNGHTVQSASPPRMVRVCIYEQVPTFFITVQDATDSPPCCIRNDCEDRAVWYSIWFNKKHRESWNQLKPLRNFRAELSRRIGRSSERSDLAAASRRERLISYYESIGVPVLWQGSDVLSPRTREMTISIRLTDPQQEDRSYEELSRDGEICEFHFSDLYRVKEIRPPHISFLPPLFGRVRMHELSPNTRMLLLSSSRELTEQMDEALDQMREGGERVENPGEIERLRHFLPSEIISSPSSAKRLQSHRILETLPACAPTSTSPAQPSFSIGLEVKLQGISLALVDSKPSTPRELLQLNLGGIDLEYTESRQMGMRLALTLRSLSVDNLLPDNFNPLLLDASANNEFSMGVGADPLSELPSLAVTIDRRNQFNYRWVSIKLAPVKLVLDLSLLRALSTMSSNGAIDQRRIEIGCSPRLRTTFEELRRQGVCLPTEMIERSHAKTYLKYVKVHSMELHVTVAMASTYESDPTKELNEMIEVLLPQVPRALEPLLPVLSNLANVTDATFHVKSYETTDRFTISIVQVMQDAASSWAAQLMRIFVSELGSLDVLAIPFGLLRRMRKTTRHAGNYAMEGVRTRNVQAFGKMVIELLHGFIGGSADSLSKVLRSLHSCVSTLGLTTSHNRRLVARERPRDILHGIDAASRVLSTTVSDACKSVYTTPCQSGKRGGTAALFKQLGASSCQCLASPLTGGLGSMVVLLSSVDSTTRKLTARKEKQRTRPPRLFEPGLPRLCLLQDRMVVQMQLVLESISGMSALEEGTLKLNVQLISGRDASYVIESHTTREIPWPRVYKWEEVVSLKPDALDDEVLFQVSHSAACGALHHTRVIGEARMRVCDANDDIVKSMQTEGVDRPSKEEESHSIPISARTDIGARLATRRPSLALSLPDSSASRWASLRHAVKRGVLPENSSVALPSRESADESLRSESELLRWSIQRGLRSAFHHWKRSIVYDLAVLRITILRASHLPNLDLVGTSEPFCVFAIEGMHTNLRRQTTIARAENGSLSRGEHGMLEVSWREHFDCFVRLEPEMRFSLQVLDHDLFTPHRLIAENLDLRLPDFDLREPEAHSPRAEKHFKLFTSPQRGEDARTCDLSVSFEARGIPKRFETEAMGHPRCCKLFKPTVVGGAPQNVGSSLGEGTLNIRIKSWDGTHDEDPDSALWRHWAGNGREKSHGPKEEARRLLQGIASSSSILS